MTNSAATLIQGLQQTLNTQVQGAAANAVGGGVVQAGTDLVKWFTDEQNGPVIFQLAELVGLWGGHVKGIAVRQTEFLSGGSIVDWFMGLFRQIGTIVDAFSAASASGHAFFSKDWRTALMEAYEPPDEQSFDLTNKRFSQNQPPAATPANTAPAPPPPPAKHLSNGGAASNLSTTQQRAAAPPATPTPIPPSVPAAVAPTSVPTAPAPTARYLSGNPNGTASTQQRAAAAPPATPTPPSIPAAVAPTSVPAVPKQQSSQSGGRLQFKLN